jgi:hypothetical protein
MKLFDVQFTGQKRELPIEERTATKDIPEESESSGSDDYDESDPDF